MWLALPAGSSGVGAAASSTVSRRTLATALATSACGSLHRGASRLRHSCGIRLVQGPVCGGALVGEPLGARGSELAPGSHPLPNECRRFPRAIHGCENTRSHRGSISIHGKQRAAAKVTWRKARMHCSSLSSRTRRHMSRSSLFRHVEWFKRLRARITSRTGSGWSTRQLSGRWSRFQALARI